MARIAACALLSLSLLVGCGGNSSGSNGQAQNPAPSNPAPPNPSNPAPSLSSISPNSAVSGSPAITITAVGSNLISSSVVEWNGVPLPTSYGSSTTITAQVSATDLQNAGTAMVTVVNPSPGGGTSGGISFTIETPNPMPVLLSMNPTSAPLGSSAQTVTVTGMNFIPSSVVQWNGAALQTTYTNSTTLNAQVSVADLQTPQFATVTVLTPLPGGGTSAALTFSVMGPIPTLNSITPTSAVSGTSDVTITATGTNFVSSSTIEWNGVALATTYLNSTALSAQISGADLQTVGTDQVYVATPAPGGGQSSTFNFFVSPVGLTVVNVVANDLAWDPVNQVIYLSLPSTDSPNGNSVQVLNPVTGVLGSSIFAGSEPNLLSVSPNSKYLYVSQNGASTVEVLTLPNLSNYQTIDLGSSGMIYGAYYAMDLQAAPNSDTSVAVVRGTPGTTPEEQGGVVIYDDGAALPDVLCGFGETGCTPLSIGDLFDSIQWNSAGTEMFAANNEDTAFDFYSIQVTSSGFGAVTDDPGLLNSFYSKIHYDSPTGYVYDDSGLVVNPNNGSIAGTFAASGPMVPDGNLGSAFFVGQLSENFGTSTLVVQTFNIQTFTPIANYTIPGVMGIPIKVIRWGTNGLAFITQNQFGSPATTGAVYLLSTSGADWTPALSERVQALWKRHGVLEGIPPKEDAQPSTN
jgi:hypothetical protein